MNTSFGRNQRLVLSIVKQLSSGKDISALHYYGGSVSQTERCISIGRDCQLYYDVPWWIVDIRHAGAIFRQARSARLGYNALRSFNRAIHGLINKGVVIPVAREIVSQGGYNDLKKEQYKYPKTAHRGSLRFVILSVPNASGHLKTPSV